MKHELWRVGTALLCGLLISGCGSSQDSVSSQPGISHETDTRLVLAPVEAIEVFTVPGDSTRYLARVTTGLPTGCTVLDGHDVVQSAATVTITTRNRVADSVALCTMIYRTVQSDIDLGRVGATLEACAFAAA